MLAWKLRSSIVSRVLTCADSRCKDSTTPPRLPVTASFHLFTFDLNHRVQPCPPNPEAFPLPGWKASVSRHWNPLLRIVLPLFTASHRKAHNLNTPLGSTAHLAPRTRTKALFLPTRHTQGFRPVLRPNRGNPTAPPEALFRNRTWHRCRLRQLPQLTSSWPRTCLQLRLLTLLSLWAIQEGLLLSFL